MFNKKLKQRIEDLEKNIIVLEGMTVYEESYIYDWSEYYINKTRCNRATIKDKIKEIESKIDLIMDCLNLEIKETPSKKFMVKKTKRRKK